MRKQVTFAENQLVQGSRQNDRLSRCDGLKDSKTALNLTSSLRSRKQPPAVPQEAAVVIPKSMPAAPHLQHAALTPAQRDFLYTIAASYSAAHVRQLITQHYLNVLHRCTRRGSPERDTSGVTSLESNEKPQSELPSGSKNLQGKINNRSARNPGRSSHPKIPSRTSKPRKLRKRQAAPGSGEATSEQEVEQEVEQEEEVDDSASDCLSSLSLTDWGADDNIWGL